jgi:hypothetical protein
VPTDPSVVVPGPDICDSARSPTARSFPAGTRCDFDVTVSYELSGTIYFFDNPPRAVAHLVGVGTATGNAHTLIRTSRFTETASPIFVITDHGLLARYSLPGGKTITVWAGYQQESIIPPLPEIFHGNPPPGVDPADTAGVLRRTDLRTRFGDPGGARDNREGGTQDERTSLFAALGIAALVVTATATSGAARIESPWRIAFTNNREGDSEIYSMNANGTGAGG